MNTEKFSHSHFVDFLETLKRKDELLPNRCVIDSIPCNKIETLQYLFL